jgi:hypothetical protein
MCQALINVAGLFRSLSAGNSYWLYLPEISRLPCRADFILLPEGLSHELCASIVLPKAISHHKRQ